MIERRVAHILVVLAVGVGAAGFFTGLSQERKRSSREAQPYPVTSAPAPGYRDLRDMRRGPNAHLYETAFDALEAKLPGLTDEVPPQTEAQRAAVLEDRATRRAYDGAPPTIPHAVVASGAFECLGCHARGLVVAGKRAPRMSHERHDNCTQCHAPSSGPPGPPREPLAGNTFVGRASPTVGERAWPGAPPTIPHSTRMRSDCGSCHGVGGSLGVRSTHPWRQSCTQCHAPSAELDGRP
ncbi:MAG: hypothetical protein KC657_05470 [Myxococcales bacterium]|nr:hypothetical protein [Myxococcales bacterium]